jgi:hypothetical protein
MSPAGRVRPLQRSHPMLPPPEKLPHPMTAACVRGGQPAFFADPHAQGGLYAVRFPVTPKEQPISPRTPRRPLGRDLPHPR